MQFIQDKAALWAQMMEILRIFEPSLVELAAERATGADIARIWDVYERTKNAIAQHVPHNQFDAAFHIAIAKAAHNDIAVNILTPTDKQVIDLSIGLSKNKLLQEAVETRWIVFEGLESRDKALTK